MNKLSLGGDNEDGFSPTDDNSEFKPFDEFFVGSLGRRSTAWLLNLDDLSSISQSGTKVSVDLSLMPIFSLLTCSVPTEDVVLSLVQPSPELLFEKPYIDGTGFDNEVLALQHILGRVTFSEVHVIGTEVPFT